MPRFQRALLASFAVLAAGSAHASVLFTADLTNGQENPPSLPLTTAAGASRPTSFGTASFQLNDASTALTFSATIFNIDVTGSQTADANDNLAVAHLHAGPSVSPATNGPVVFGFVGTPFNDLSPNDVVVTPFATGTGGTFTSKWDASEGNGTTLTAQLPNILANRFYINFHTVQYPGGEIRGNAQAVATPVPEPTSLALLGTAVVGLLGASRRRRAAV